MFGKYVIINNYCSILIFSDIGIVGGNIGEIVFVNLRTGACLGSTCVKCSITTLEILNESCSNTVWLIVSILFITFYSHNIFVIIVNLFLDYQ